MEPPVHERCLNCDWPLEGPFCPNCGQRDVATERGLAELVREFVHETFELDGRLPRTLWLFVSRPGALTSAYAEGKRAAYTTPVRLYVFMAVVSLFVSALLTVQVVDRTPKTPEVEADYAELRATVAQKATGESAVETRLRQGVLAEQDSAAAFSHEMTERMFEWLPVLMILTVVMSALMLKLLYWRRAMEVHLVFALHVHAMMLLVMLLASVVSALVVHTAEGYLASSLAQMGIIAVWGVVAAREVYAQSWPATLLKGLAFWTLYMALALAISALAYALLLLL